MSDERTFVDGMMDDYVYRIGDDIKDAGERLMYLDGCSADDMRWAIGETISDIRKALDKLKEQEEKVINWIQVKGRANRAHQ